MSQVTINLNWSFSSAISSGSLSQVSSLLSSNPYHVSALNYVPANNTGAKSLLLQTIENSLFDIARLLASAGACIDPEYEAEHANELRLWTAVLRGDLDELRRRIDAGDSVDQAPQGGKARGWTALWLAVALGREDAARMLIQNGANVNAVCYFNQINSSLLHLTASLGYFDLTELLVEARSNLNVVNQSGETPLTLALSNGHLEIARYLIQGGANVDHLRTNCTLSTVAANGHAEAVSFLIDLGMNVDAESANHGVPILAALYAGYAEVARILIRAGADTNCVRSSAVWLLHQVAQKGQADVAEVLVELGLNVDALYGEELPLCCAIRHEHADVARVLVNAGANIDFIRDQNHGRDYNEFNEKFYEALRDVKCELARLLADLGAHVDPKYDAEHANELRLWTAVLRGDLDELRRRIDAGDNVDQAPQGGTAEGWTALWLAVKLGREDAARMLIQAGADVNLDIQSYHWDNISTSMLTILVRAGASFSNLKDHTLLHLASSKGDFTLALEAIQAGFDVDVDAVDLSGKTALLTAVTNGHCDIARLLVEAGADVKTLLSSHPLHDAVARGACDVAQLLIQLGAKVNAPNTDGVFPLFLALTNGHADVARLLLDAGARINAAGNDGNTPLHIAIEKGLVNIVRVLIEKEAITNKFNKAGCAPLHLAVTRGHIGIVRLLIEAGANIDTKDKACCTPLYLATEKGATPLVQALIQAGANVNFKNQQGRTPLQVAADKGLTAIAGMLVQAAARQ